jgi:hypothetical protein
MDDDVTSLKATVDNLKAAFDAFKSTNVELEAAISELSLTRPPIGSILPFGGATLPSGWWSCNGDEKDNTDPDCKALFEVTAVRLKVEENQLVNVFGEIGTLVDRLKSA